MHIGNLRTALYEYLVAKKDDGTFILRIEDTDQERLVEGAVDLIYTTLKECGLDHDEGPDVGGDYGSYVQSERMASGIYKEYAEKLIELGARALLLLQRGATDSSSRRKKPKPKASPSSTMIPATT